MKAKILYIPALIFILFWLFIQRFKSLFYSVSLAQIKNPADILAGGLNTILDLHISNYGNYRLKVNNIYLEIYSLDNTLLAYQTDPIKPFTIEANNTVTVKLNFWIKSAFLYKIAEQINKPVKDIIWKYLQTGKFGTKIKIKGAIYSLGLRIPINFDYEI